MPPLAKTAVDAEAVRALTEWIHSLDPSAWPDNSLPVEPNYPPLARSDIAYVSPAAEGHPIAALTNDIDPDGSLDPASLAIVTSPLGAVITSGDFFLYTPADPAAPDTFTYQIADHQGLLSNEARVTIEIRAHHINWLHANFTAAELASPQISSWTADPDGDRFSNLVEYALATDPRDSASLPSTTPVREAIGGQEYYTLTIDKIPHADITWTIESSDDLDHWHDATVITDSATQLKAHTPTPITTTQRSYLRLRVQLVE